MKRVFSLFAALALFSSGLLAQIAPNVIRQKAAGLDLILYKTGVQDVVTIKGSFPAGDAFAGDGNAAIPTLTGMLLDQGTTKHDKFAIADLLESVGASISFSVGDQSVEVSAKCLKKDVPLVVGLIAEQLREPAFAAEEFEKAKKEFIGGQQRAMENPDHRAGEAFTRAVFPVGHPNRSATSEEFVAAAESAKLEDVKAFHAKHYGPAHFTLVAVGDVDPAQIQTEVAKAFAGWTGGVDYLHPAKATGTDAPRDQTVFMADKTSVSVFWGQPSGLRSNDPDYQALRVANAILGSGFTGRLMGRVRDQDGLTYRTYSRLQNDTLTDGAWVMYASFAPALLDKGVAALKRELTAWHDQGVTEKEFTDRKTNLVGEFKVALATTDGLSAALLNAVERGYGPAWLDDYPKKISALTLPEVNGAIKKYLKPESMFLVKAGTVAVPGTTPAAK